MKKSCRLIVGALVIAATPLLTSPSAGAPMSLPLALQDAMLPSVETIQYRRGSRGFRAGRQSRVGIGAGIAGAIIGGAILGAQPYGYAYGPYYGQRTYYPGYAVSDPVAYCLRRFRSYDPMSGTYLGFDGYRHPCP